jgi:hypothetical protein
VWNVHQSLASANQMRPRMQRHRGMNHTLETHATDASELSTTMPSSLLFACGVFSLLFVMSGGGCSGAYTWINVDLWSSAGCPGQTGGHTTYTNGTCSPGSTGGYVVYGCSEDGTTVTQTTYSDFSCQTPAGGLTQEISGDCFDTMVGPATFSTTLTCVQPPDNSLASYVIYSDPACTQVYGSMSPTLTGI